MGKRNLLYPCLHGSVYLIAPTAFRNNKEKGFLDAKIWVRLTIVLFSLQRK